VNRIRLVAMKRPRVLLLIAPLLIVALVPPARATKTDAQRGPIRIRHTTEPREVGGRPLTRADFSTGIVISNDAENVTLMTDAGTEVIPLASVTSIERYAGTRRQTLLGALIGAPVGALAGYGIANIANTDEELLEDVFSADLSKEDAGMYVLVGAGIGAALGAIVGSQVKTDRWETTSVSALQLQTGVSERSTTLSLTIRF
jgi:hypothetical protein